MRKASISILMLCLAGTVAMAQSGGIEFLPEFGTMEWQYRGGRADDANPVTLYQESTNSAFFIPYRPGQVASVGEDMPDGFEPFGGTPSDPKPGNFWSVTGFSFGYRLRASLNQLPVTATVRFLTMDPNLNFVANVWHTEVIPNLATGVVNLSYTLTPKVVVPKNVWLDIAFTQIPDIAATTRNEGVGLMIAQGLGPNQNEGTEGGASDDVFLVNAGGVGGTAGLSFFGGYTPGLTTLDPNWNPPGNFLMSVSGKNIPEPMTLGLMAMALTGVAALRRRR